MAAEAERNPALLAWYAENRRDLPWRRSSDPWPVLVSEVMLQQTAVSRVVPAFEAFLARFPTPARLAAATGGEVIAAWGDLGYQRRAVNLWRAARLIERHGWPEDPSGLRALPGVGPYTAAAVACFAFGHQVPAVDVNLRRVLSRWEGRLLGTDAPEVAARLLAGADARDWNQAVMDLGAGVCRRREPRCGACPVATWCRDPGVEPPRARQGRYEGSVRQARAAVLKALAEGERDERSLGAKTGASPERIEQALTALAAEGLVRREGGRARLAM